MRKLTELVALLETQKNEVEKGIKIELLERGWTQKKLSDLIGENRAMVNRAIKGDTTPRSIEIRSKIFEVLNLK